MEGDESGLPKKTVWMVVTQAIQRMTEDTYVGKAEESVLTDDTNMDHHHQPEPTEEDPPHPSWVLNVSSDARDLYQACANEFVHMVSEEANVSCDAEQRRTITPDHLFAALERLGFGEYVERLRPLLKDVKQEQQERCRKKGGRARFEHTGLSMEELKRQQAELFEAAREQPLHS